jgi:methylmalonyl-CoA/ethylmalonyl-CoA epimerase
MIKKVHHIGIAVKNIEESMIVFENLLDVKPHLEDVPGQKVREAVFHVGDGMAIDLLAPTGPDSAVAKFLESRGEGIHHVALEVDDINAELKNMEKKGFRLIDEEGREGVAGQIGFLHPKSVNGVLVELVQPRE